jgi:hypothetical protein
MSAAHVVRTLDPQPHWAQRTRHDAFRNDRRVCRYEHVTGESLEGVSLTEQQQRAHDLARSWRAYSDGRPGKSCDAGCSSAECPAPAEAQDGDEHGELAQARISRNLVQNLRARGARRNFGDICGFGRDLRS